MRALNHVLGRGISPAAAATARQAATFHEKRSEGRTCGAWRRSVNTSSVTSRASAATMAYAPPIAPKRLTSTMPNTTTAASAIALVSTSVCCRRSEINAFCSVCETKTPMIANAWTCRIGVASAKAKPPIRSITALDASASVTATSADSTRPSSIINWSALRSRAWSVALATDSTGSARAITSPGRPTTTSMMRADVTKSPVWYSVAISDTMITIAPPYSTIIVEATASGSVSRAKRKAAALSARMPIGNERRT